MSNFKIWWNLNVKALAGLYSWETLIGNRGWDVESVADLAYQVGYEEGFLAARELEVRP